MSFAQRLRLVHGDPQQAKRHVACDPLVVGGIQAVFHLGLAALDASAVAGLPVWQAICFFDRIKQQR